MAFNSSHLTFCLANLLAFYLAFSLAFYMAVVSGRWGPVEVRRGPRRAESCRLKSGEAHSAPNRLRSGEAQLRSGEAHSAQTLAG